MSRDRDDAAGAQRDTERDAELLAAYVDGVAELSPEDRRRVEARLEGDPKARADQASLRTLLGQLRALPLEGNEPDWGAMERSIRDAVGSEVTRPWWRAWRWLVPVMSCATAAAVMLLLWSHPRSIREPSVAMAPPVAGTRQLPQPVDGRDEPSATVPLWLDGAAVDVDLSAAEMLPVPGIGDDDLAQPDTDDGDGVALLPAGGLAWVDHLDDDALARAERWLSDGAKDGGGSSDRSPARKKS
jgi:hypothetical protein